MSQLVFKESPLTNTVMKSLERTNDYLNQAVREIYSIDIPGDFSQSGNLHNCVNSIKNIRDEINNLKNWGADSCTKIHHSVDNMRNVASLLPKTKVQIRTEIIR